MRLPVDLPGWMLDELDVRAAREGRTREELIAAAIDQLIDAHEATRPRRRNRNLTPSLAHQRRSQLTSRKRFPGS